MATASSFSPPSSTNVLGALTFTLCVLSALVLTTYISISLLRTYNTATLSSVQNARIQLFATLATISFATLSYNMLRFLISSYRAWALQQPHPIPLPQGGNGLGGIVADAWRQVDIWQWLKDSTLFEDFAHEALGSQARSWWTINALCASIIWAVSMSIEGKKHSIPRLWAYAAIAQILPVSFAQNLFYVATLLSAPASSPSSAPSKSPETSPPSNKPSSSPETPTRSTMKLESVYQTAPLLLYYVLIALSPTVATSQNYSRILLLLVGLIRLLLLAPLFSPVAGRTPDATPVVAKTTATTGSAVLFGYQTLAALRDNSWDVVSVLEAVSENPAVAALGWDCLISVASAAVWIWMDGWMTKVWFRQTKMRLLQ